MRPLLKKLEALGRRQDGAAAVEFAVVATVFLTVCVATVELGRLLLIHNEMAYAADRGVRYALITSDDEEEIEDGIKDEIEEAFVSHGGGDADDLEVTFPADDDPTNYRTFDLEYAVDLLIFDADINLTISRRVPV